MTIELGHRGRDGAPRIGSWAAATLTVTRMIVSSGQVMTG